jgi:trimeric autotransporter adhesin
MVAQRLSRVVLCLVLLAFVLVGQPALARPAPLAPTPAQPLQQPHPAVPQSSPADSWANDFLLGVEDAGNESASNVFALAVDGADLYVGGDFSAAGRAQASNIARWDGTERQWAPLGGGVNNRVRAIAVSGDSVYVGGSFGRAGDVAVTGFARWNKAARAWSSLGTFTMDAISPEIRAIGIAPNGDVYVGGTFAGVEGIAARNIAYHNASGWHALGSGAGCSPAPCNSEVHALAFYGGSVYVGGVFTTAGGVPAKNLARWDGSWHRVGGGVGGFNASVDSLAFLGSSLYVAGSFSEAYDGAGGVLDVSSVACWTGAVWNSLAGGVNIDAAALVARPDGVYVAGRFTTAGGSDIRRVARWNGAAWQGLKSPGETYDGVDNNAYALASDTDSIYIGGTFEHAGDSAAHHIAAFRPGNKWSGLGDGLNGGVYALCAQGGYIYVGGAFTSAGSITQLKIARWHPASKQWYYAGPGADVTGCTGLGCEPIVRAIYSDGSYLYIGGNFTRVGGVTVSGIARLNWSTYEWSSMGGGVSCVSSCGATVYAIIPYPDGIYVGGDFDKAGGVTANNVAAWNGSGWQALADFSDNGTNGTVYALATLTGGAIAVGGNFSSPESYIARWNGANWNPIGTPLNGTVRAMAGGSSAPLYIGGSFTSPSRVAVLRNNAWEALGAGLNGTVYSLVLDPQKNLYAGGAFTGSGAVGTNRIASWNGSAWSPLGMGTSGPVYALAYTGRWLYAGGSFTEAGGRLSFYLARWGSIPLYLPLTKKP